MGVRRTNSFLEKATWTLVGCLVVLSIASAFTMPKANDGSELRTRPAAAPLPLQLPPVSSTLLLPLLLLKLKRLQLR